MGAPGHPKTKELRLVLACPLAQAVGHLELLWHFCAQHSPAGDIGKWTDAAIAEAAGWLETTTAPTFIDAMVQTGWLERHSKHRLIVHDWREHAPAWVSAKLHKLNIQWVISESPSKTLLEDSPSPTTLPSPPSLAKPRDKNKNGRAYALPAWLDVKVWADWEQHRREKKQRLTPLTIGRQLKFLEKHQTDHVAIINQAIEKGWTGLFPLKDNHGNREKSGGQSAPERVRAANAKYK